MSIVATVIGGVILLLRKLTRRRLSPSANYLICLTFLITLIFPVALPSRVSIYNLIDIEDVKYESDREDDIILEQWKQLEDISAIKENLMNHTTERFLKIKINYISITIASIWFIIFMAKLIKTMFSYIALGISVENDSVKDERVELILERCKEKLKIKRNIKVVKQDLVKSPSTTGIFNVKILMTDFICELDDIELSSILMHELSHYKRKDNVVNFIILILKCVYWFNPMMKIMFKNIRNDMELATDEIAISKMDVEEQRVYCKLMLWIAALPSLPTLKKEQVLGLSNGRKMIEKRIDMISLQETFEKNAKIILASTILIILFLCFVLYPTSYGKYTEPKLYWKLENGEKVELTKIEENADVGVNEIKLTPESEVELIVKEGKSKGYIFYNIMNLNTMELKRTANMSSNKITYFESGEYIYKFTVPYGNNQSIDYAIKIIVE